MYESNVVGDPFRGLPAPGLMMTGASQPVALPQARWMRGFIRSAPSGARMDARIHTRFARWMRGSIWRAKQEDQMNARIHLAAATPR